MANDTIEVSELLNYGRYVFHLSVLTLSASNEVKAVQVTSQNPDVMSGALVFSGTRVPVDILIDYLKAGDSLERFLEGFPTVSREQAEAFLQEALESVKLRHDATAA